MRVISFLSARSLYRDIEQHRRLAWAIG